MQHPGIPGMYGACEHSLTWSSTQKGTAQHTGCGGRVEEYLHHSHGGGNDLRHREPHKISIINKCTQCEAPLQSSSITPLTVSSTDSTLH